jgi:hypothetical protein
VSADDRELGPVEERLRREQPVPAVGFRGELGRWIAGEHAPARPARLGLLAGGCLALGLVLLLAAALSL